MGKEIELTIDKNLKKAVIKHNSYVPLLSNGIVTESVLLDKNEKGKLSIYSINDSFEEKEYIPIGFFKFSNEGFLSEFYIEAVVEKK